MPENLQREELAGEGTPSVGGDIVGPGTGGSPTAAGTGAEPDREDAANEPEVADLVENLRSDRAELESDVDEAAEQAGTGTDR